jgi:ribosomal-protein-alanine N-acetyltransferase
VYPVRIEGPRVVLCEVQPDDAAAIFTYAHDPQVTAHLVWDPHPDVTVTQAYVESVIAAATGTDRCGYELAVTVNDEVVGMGRISVRSPAHRSGDLGYVLRRDRWGRGLGKEVATALVDFGFTTLGLHRIFATCHPDNVASRRVLEATGMVYEGRLRDHMLVRGQFRDSLLFAVLATDPHRPRKARRGP